MHPKQECTKLRAKGSSQGESQSLTILPTLHLHAKYQNNQIQKTYLNRNVHLDTLWQNAAQYLLSDKYQL